MTQQNHTATHADARQTHEEPRLDAIAARAGVDGKTLAALCSPVLPSASGESVWAFLWRTEPGSIELMIDPVGGLVEANAKARKRAGRRAELSFVSGIGGVWLVPEPVLERLFPATV